MGLALHRCKKVCSPDRTAPPPPPANGVTAGRGTGCRHLLEGDRAAMIHLQIPFECERPRAAPRPPRDPGRDGGGRRDRAVRPGRPHRQGIDTDLTIGLSTPPGRDFVLPRYRLEASSGAGRPGGPRPGRRSGTGRAGPWSLPERSMPVVLGEMLDAAWRMPACTDGTISPGSPRRPGGSTR